MASTADAWHRAVKIVEIKAQEEKQNEMLRSFSGLVVDVFHVTSESVLAHAK